MSKIIVKDADYFIKALDNMKRGIDELETEANNCIDAIKKKVWLKMLIN